VADQHDHDDGYTGPAVLSVDGREIPVHVQLDARHEPQDGRLHWFGRMRLQDADAATALTAPDAALVLGVAGHRSPARVGDVDMWGRYRVTGVGTLPYPQEEPVLD
jgi:hypothetical protein